MLSHRAGAWSLNADNLPALHVESARLSSRYLGRARPCLWRLWQGIRFRKQVIALPLQRADRHMHTLHMWQHLPHLLEQQAGFHAQ